MGLYSLSGYDIISVLYGEKRNAMSFVELALLSVGLAMDAFAVSICRGLKMRRINYRHALIISLFFGGFQALMPIIGWAVGSSFASYIQKYSHFVAFALLAFIGVKMVVESIREKRAEDEDDFLRLDIKELFLLAVATSIDALAVGVTFALMPEVNVWYSSAEIGIITFLISGAGVVIGNKFGARFKSGAEIAGGIILVLIGLKILLEGLGLIGF